MKSILLIGMGSLGTAVLNILALDSTYKITIAGRNEEYLLRMTNMLNQSLLQMGIQKKINYEIFDLFNIDDTSDKLARVNPDMIFTAVSLQSWWVISELPKDIFTELEAAGVGPWLPMHLTLIYKLMIAVRQSNIKARVINSSYPDVVNPILSKIGLGPYIGIGNVANPVPGIRYSTAHTLKCSPTDIEVRLFAHHAVSYRISRKGSAINIPFHLTIYKNGTDITPSIDLDRILDLLPGQFRRLSGKEGQQMTASSAVSIIKALNSDKMCAVHAPGPFGLEGGYAMLISENSMKINLPADLTIDAAIELNKAGGYFDGIEKIESDGTIWFNMEKMEIMKKIVGYSVRSFNVLDTERYAHLLKKLYKSLSFEYSK